MGEFDPERRSLLVYDTLNDRLYDWDWDWTKADDYAKEGTLQPDGMVRWRETCCLPDGAKPRASSQSSEAPFFQVST